MLFNKKEKVEFNATQIVYPGIVEYDKNQNLLMIKNGLKKDYVNPQDIEDILVNCGNKSVSKKNLGSSLACAAVFGAKGLLLSGYHQVDYISNLTITIITKEKRIVIPLVIGKIKKGNQLEIAEKIVGRIEELA